MKAPVNSTHSLKKLTLLLILSFSFTCHTILAQNFTEFKGKVTSKNNGKALALADLTVKGTNISTISNTDGKFALKVPNTDLNKSVIISYLGYKKAEIPISELKKRNTKIQLVEAATVLAQVDVSAPKSAENLVRKALKLKGDNYYNNKSVMTGFYREIIKKRNKNLILFILILY